MIADRVAVAHAAAPADAAARMKQGFEQCRFAREIRSDQRGTTRCRNFLCHGRLQWSCRTLAATARPTARRRLLLAPMVARLPPRGNRNLVHHEAVRR